MKIDKTKLIQDIEAMKEKLASMEEELNKPEEFKHFPSKGDVMYTYTTLGSVIGGVENKNILRINSYKTREEAQKAYNKAVALEKVKRRIIELQGDWNPDFNTDNSKYLIFYNYNNIRFENSIHSKVKFPLLIPYIKKGGVANTIIAEMEDELKVIFDIT